MLVAVNFHLQVNVASCHSKSEVHQVRTKQLFKALNVIETLKFRRYEGLWTALGLLLLCCCLGTAFVYPIK